MKLLKIGISGVRGIVGESMTPKLAMDFAAAFGTFVGGRPVLLGRDTRVSSPMLRAACLAALASTGCDVYDQGVCPTPILQFLVRFWSKRIRVKGGISITAGHNDIDWNALAFVGPDGTTLNAFQGQEVLDIYHLGKFKKVPVERIGVIRHGPDATDRYFAALARFLETGEPLSEEYAFPLLADDYLRTRCGAVITNFSTSRMVEDVARDRNCPLVNNEL